MTGSSRKGKNKKKKGQINSQKHNIINGHDELAPRPSSPNMELSGDDQADYQIYDQIHVRIKAAFKRAVDRLTIMRYSLSTAQKAVIRRGHIIGDKDMVTNILRSSISYLENCIKINGEYVFEDDFLIYDNFYDHLVSVWVHTLKNVAKNYYPPETLESDFLRDMLHCKLLTSSDKTMSPSFGEGDTEFDIFLRTNADKIIEELGHVTRLSHVGNQNEASSSRVSKSSAATESKQLSVRKNLKSSIEVEWLGEYASIQEWFANSPDEEDEKMIKLKNLVRDLEVQVKEKKDWAEKKEREVADKEEKHSLLLANLRQETSAVEELRKENKCLETVQVDKILEASTEINRNIDHIFLHFKKRDEIKKDNSELVKDVSVWKGDIAHLKKQLKQATRKEKKDLQTIEKNAAEIMELEEMMNQKKLENSRLHQRLQDATEAQKKNQLRLRVERAAKDKASQLCLEERRLLKMEEEAEQQRLASLQRESESLHEDFRRIKDFADRQTTLYPTSTGLGGYVFREFPINTYQSEIPHHKRCVICNRKEACVLFMPCSHSVVCWDCNARVPECCPFCQCQVQQKIGIYEDRTGS